MHACTSRDRAVYVSCKTGRRRDDEGVLLVSAAGVVKVRLLPTNDRRGYSFNCSTS